MTRIKKGEAYWSQLPLRPPTCDLSRHRGLQCSESDLQTISDRVSKPPKDQVEHEARPD